MSGSDGALLEWEWSLKESLLEPWLRRMRINKVLPTIKQYPNGTLLDIGCGFNHKLLSTAAPFIRRGYGIDFKVPEISTDKLEVSRFILDDQLPYADNSFDVVTMLAVLEHLSKPLEIVQEAERVLKPEGRLLVTVPSRLSDPILTFLSEKLHIVSKDEIRDHKRYYDYRDLKELFQETGFGIERHHYFQLGMNNFCIMRKGG